MEQKPTIGGQAVLEGVMMKSPQAMAIAVRRQDGYIDVHTEAVNPPAPKTTFYGWPIVRGVVNFIQMMVMGMRTITLSADMIGLEEEEPTAFEKKLARLTGKRVEDIMMFVAIIIAVVLAAGLFIALPAWASSGLQRAISSPLLLSLLEGLVRILLFVAYLFAVSNMKEIRRTFMYHGAEHKTVYCYENDAELTPENARTFSRLHPRCGTSFLLIVMVISILFFSMLGAMGFRGGFFFRVGTRLLLMPLVAGVSYEVLRFVAKHDGPLIRALRWPGMQLQRLTTREPSDDMLEVAIAAMKASLGQPWRTQEEETEAQNASAQTDASTTEGMRDRGQPHGAYPEPDPDSRDFNNESERIFDQDSDQVSDLDADPDSDHDIDPDPDSASPDRPSTDPRGTDAKPAAVLPPKPPIPASDDGAALG